MTNSSTIQSALESHWPNPGCACKHTTHTLSAHSPTQLPRSPTMLPDSRWHVKHNNTADSNMPCKDATNRCLLSVMITSAPFLITSTRSATSQPPHVHSALPGGTPHTIPHQHNSNDTTPALGELCSPLCTQLAHAQNKDRRRPPRQQHTMHGHPPRCAQQT